MPDFDKVTAGQSLSIPARTWNEVLDMLAWSKTVRGGDRQSQASRSIREYHTVLGSNYSGGDLPRGSVVELYLPQPNPRTDAASQEACENGQYSYGVRAPTGWEYSHGITLEPILSGTTNYGRVLLNGIVTAKVDIKNALDRYADFTRGDSTKLTSQRNAGCAEILTQNGSGTGNQQCLLRLGNRTNYPPHSMFWTSTTGGQTIAANANVIFNASGPVDATGYDRKLDITQDGAGVFTYNGPHRLLINWQLHAETGTLSSAGQTGFVDFDLQFDSLPTPGTFTANIFTHRVQMAFNTAIYSGQISACHQQGAATADDHLTYGRNFRLRCVQYSHSLGAAQISVKARLDITEILA